ncbi:MAG: Cof-type HAD-IIB family hydrolase [Bacteroidaceae bacterium]|nr:Cof-type HAD-IIB family hydrolase [Bacteroidaceae bacterium]
MKYKLIVLDVDGTMLNSNRELTKRTAQTLRKVQQMGIRVALASGRPTYGILPLAQAIDLGVYDGYIISYNGAQVMEAKTGQIIFERRIDPQMVPYLEKKAAKMGLTMAYYDGNEVVSTDITNPHIVDEAEMNGMTLRQDDVLSLSMDDWPAEVMLVSDDEEALSSLEQHMQRHLNGVMDTIHSNPYYLEIVGYQVGKSYAMSALVQKMGIGLDEVLAIGDGEADINMIQMAGTGVAMANATEGVRRCADFTTLSNDQDGAALAIEKAIVQEARIADVPIDAMNAQSGSTLMGNLGIQYTFASADRVEATMPVDHRTRQPFGILHGGATLALAETVAGLGSMIACQPDEFVVGMQVSGNHVSSAHEGDTVRAVCTPVHLGRSSHVWNVDVFTSTDKLVSSIRVVNSVMKKRG